MSESLANFWGWFASGTAGRPGYSRIFNKWLLVHIGIGLVAALLISQSLESVAEKALLPVMAIFVGLTFSWAGNAHALMQSPEILKFASYSNEGIEGYIFSFQLCILILLTTMVFWVIPSLQIPYPVTGGVGFWVFNFICEWFLYALLSLAMRSSWHAVLGANLLLLVRARSLQR